MKKFMKALAFAMVMCMLLSVAAFAENPAATLDTDYQFDVVVATSEAEPVSLLVVKQNTNLNNLQNGDILFVGQEDSNGSSATFADITVAAGNDVVDIYAGYASNSEDAAVSYKGFSVKAAPVLSISLVDVDWIQNVEKWVEEEGTAELNGIKKPDNDYASVVFADVTFSEAFTAANVVSKIGWEIDTIEDGTKYAEVDATGLNVLEGPVKIGLSFTNGSKDEERPHLTIDGVNLFFRVFDGTINKEMQAMPVANN